MKEVHNADDLVEMTSDQIGTYSGCINSEIGLLYVKDGKLTGFDKDAMIRRELLVKFDLPRSIQTLKEHLRNEPGYKQGWMSAIVTAIKDEFKDMDLSEIELTEESLQGTADSIAYRFINNFING